MNTKMIVTGLISEREIINSIIERCAKDDIKWTIAINRLSYVWPNLLFHATIKDSANIDGKIIGVATIKSQLVRSQNIDVYSVENWLHIEVERV